MRDEGSYADDRVVDVLRKLVADRLADLYVGLSGKENAPRSDTVSRSQTMTFGFMRWRSYVETFARRRGFGHFCLQYLNDFAQLVRQLLDSLSQNMSARLR